MDKEESPKGDGDPLDIPSAAAIAAAPPATQKQMIGMALQSLIRGSVPPEDLNKITGMLLEQDNSKIVPLLRDLKGLEKLVKDAILVLQVHKAKGLAAAKVKE